MQAFDCIFQRQEHESIVDKYKQRQIDFINMHNIILAKLEVSQQGPEELSH